MSDHSLRPVLIGGLLLLTACGDRPGGPAVREAIAVIEERYVTAPEPEANIDSIAVAPASADQPALLFATAKASDLVKVFDASTGAALSEIGGSGAGPDRYRRPNGVSVVDDLLIVVERDNRRINVRSVADRRVLAAFGESELRYPYGLWVQRLAPEQYRVYVTDAYETPDERVPPDSELGERVKSWLLTVERDAHGVASALTARFERAFGETSGPGVLRVVESIFGDPTYDRLLIAEEEEDSQRGRVIKVYDLAGWFTGEIIGRGVFLAQAEGIALAGCEDGSGYWLSADQADDRNVFQVFDRRTLEHVGAFRGALTANTDGIWLAPAGVPGFPEGAFYAVHDDQAVSAFDWAEIRRVLDLTACA